MNANTGAFQAISEEKLSVSITRRSLDIACQPSRPPILIAPLASCMGLLREVVTIWNTSPAATAIARLSVTHSKTRAKRLLASAAAYASGCRTEGDERSLRADRRSSPGEKDLAGSPERRLAMSILSWARTPNRMSRDHMTLATMHSERCRTSI